MIGLGSPDDAAVIRLGSGRLIVQTVDFFTPVVDDPYLFGQIAAANALSDIYAMGASPLFALNILGFPVNDLPLDYMTRILQGGADKAREAGISVVGGHSIDDREPKYGLAVTGEVDEKDLITISNGKPGDILILTKPIGTGILSTALKKGRISESDMESASTSMTTLNKMAAETMVSTAVRAATDITGFGLVGHLFELCRSSNCGAELSFSMLPLFPLVKELAAEGTVPGGTRRNLDYFGSHIDIKPDVSDVAELLFADPQTSGGMLVACPPYKVEAFLEMFYRNSGTRAVSIGRLTEAGEPRISILP